MFALLNADHQLPVNERWSSCCAEAYDCANLVGKLPCTVS